RPAAIQCLSLCCFTVGCGVGSPLTGQLSSEEATTVDLGSPGPTVSAPDLGAADEGMNEPMDLGSSARDSSDAAIPDQGSSDTGAVDAGVQPSGLDPNAAPGSNFDLRTWKITFPDGSEEEEAWLSSGGISPPHFLTDSTTGGMVFRVPNRGGSTSGSTYSRTELREMLRAGDRSVSTRGINRNNWVLSTASTTNQQQAGGVDGSLLATLRVDRVSTSGDDGRVGRVIVGQIHASENEPCRLYYRKLPGNALGSIYFAYEPNRGSEQWIEILGSRDSDAENPGDGIALGESWSYRIDVSGHALQVTIERPGKPDAVGSVDMSSGDLDEDWFYFKAGAYNQNNTGSEDDFAQATFFHLEASHSAPR
ncbi:MAG: polysaccharide lyase family 7 protein, partial [Myxococcota bacterium]